MGLIHAKEVHSVAYDVTNQL